MNLKVNIKSKKYRVIAIVSFLCLVILLVFAICLKYKINTTTYNGNIIKINEKQDSEIKNNNIVSNEEKIINIDTKEKIFTDNIVGYLSISKIGLENEVVKEGVSLEVINYNIGHFSNTSIFNGNIGLAAHNGGVINASFFEKLYTLEFGDIINYETKYGKRIYKVVNKVIIDSYDWSYLDKTNSNVVTLITCVKEDRSKRLCVVANEVKENI